VIASAALPATRVFVIVTRLRSPIPFEPPAL
jgi:hypothetical protein